MFVLDIAGLRIGERRAKRSVALSPRRGSCPPLEWEPPWFREEALAGEPALHVVLGAGQVGTLVGRALRVLGHRVLLVRRSAGPSDIAGVETSCGDLSDAEFVAHVTDGATSVYHCARPYPSEWPPMQVCMARAIAKGTRQSGANLVVLDDLSVYEEERLVRAETPMRPRTYAGRLRAEAAGILLDPSATRCRRVVIGRAADLFGPGVTRSVVFGEEFFRRVLAGRPARVYGDPDLPHSYSYAPDVAKALVTLGTSGSACGTYLLPAQFAGSTRAMIQRFYRSLGVALDVSRASTWPIRLKGLLDPGADGLAQMLERWIGPLVVDDGRIRMEFGLEPTPLDDAVATTLAWARSAFASTSRENRSWHGWSSSSVREKGE
jgi:nucleoside-diphosphate-sugar epimerase